MERIWEYTLHGVSNSDGRMENISLRRNDPLRDGGNITYTLPAHRFYHSIYFEIKTAAGHVKITSGNFSKIVIMSNCNLI